MIYKTDEQLNNIYKKVQLQIEKCLQNVSDNSIKNDKIRFFLERENFIRLREKEEWDFFDDFWDEAKAIGTYGENLTIFDLELLKVKGYNGNILHNLYIPYNNGKTSEIDILFITKKGIFVIESKNYSGWIYGSEKDQYWTVCDKRDRWKLYNPIKQNQGHINTIHQHLRGIPCFSLIVFSERCELKKININSDVYVFKRDKMFFKVSEIFKNFPDVMDENQVNYVTDYMKRFCDADKNIKTSHLDDVTNY